VNSGNKMSEPIQPISELTNRATNALIRELGVVDAMRFLSQFGVGSGDYTAEREHLFGDESVKSLVEDIKVRRSGGV
jgi:hypothetical protein